MRSKSFVLRVTRAELVNKAVAAMALSNALVRGYKRRRSAAILAMPEVSGTIRISFKKHSMLFSSCAEIELKLNNSSSVSVETKIGALRSNTSLMMGVAFGSP